MPDSSGLLDEAKRLYPKKSAMERQEGGGHYRDMPIQPAKFIHANKIPHLEGSAIEYIIRHRHKNGAEDLRKAIHGLELLLELEYPEET